MKGLFPLFLWMAFPVSIPAYAKIELLAIEDQSGIKSPPLVERFDAETISFPAVFAINPAKIPQLGADIFLDGDTLGVPLIQALPFKAQAQGENPALLHGNFNIRLPVVDGPSDFRIAVTESSPENADSKEAVAEFRIRIYPRDYFGSKLVEASLDREFFLFGHLPCLREFLKSLGIKWTEAGDLPPLSLPKKTILIADFPVDTPLPKLDKNASCLVYRPSSLDLPGTLREIKDCTVSYIVNAEPPLAWLENPSGQRFLLDFLNQTTP